MHTGSCPLDCDVGYFEVKVGKNPKGVQIGVMRIPKEFEKNLPQHLNGQLNNHIYTNPNEKSPAYIFDYSELSEGDVVGIHWDQTDLPMVSFALNGVEYAQSAINRVRPANNVYPAISLCQSQCDLIFNEKEFCFKPKSSKFKMIVCATSLI